MSKGRDFWISGRETQDEPVRPHLTVCPRKGGFTKLKVYFGILIPRIYAMFSAASELSPQFNEYSAVRSGEVTLLTVM
jgi:hypothetical protein